MKSSLLGRSVELQSASLPGRLSRCDTAVLRDTACDAARLASRARAARIMRATSDLGDGRFSVSHFSSAVRMAPSTSAVTSGLLSLSLVCPGTAARPRTPERIAVGLADVLGRQRYALGGELCTSMKLRTALTIAALQPRRACVPARWDR